MPSAPSAQLAMCVLPKYNAIRREDVLWMRGSQKEAEMSQRLVVFDPQDLYQLLLHYDDGKSLPLHGLVKGFAVSPILQRFLGLEVQADSWPTGAIEGNASNVMPMVHIRYEGKKVMNWTDKHEEVAWTEAPDAPNRQ